VGDLPPFASWESRPGLAIDQEHTARAGLLYFLRVVRMAPRSGFAAWLQADLMKPIPGEDALTSGAMQAGRKARMLHLKRLPTTTTAWQELRDGKHLPQQVPGDPYIFWLYLASPMCPEPNETADTPRLPAAAIPDSSPPLTARVRLAQLHKPLILGGLEHHGKNARRRPRNNRAWVPPGSAWLIELRGGTAESRAEYLRSLHNSCTLGRATERPFGAGRTFVGLLPPTLQPKGE
jgi:hypothetical protein